jgi:hypothetical protein
VLVVGCGALARELVDLTRNLPNVDISCLPATLHNRPGGIPAAVRDRVRRRRAGYDRVFVAYADCGTGGLLDRMLAGEGIDRLPGAHCYEFYAGRPNFARLTDEEPATFFLTDFLARNFDRLVWRGLGLDRHPELLAQYFGNYRRLVYLSQRDDPELGATARRAAQRLGLAFEHRPTGYGELATSIFAAALPAVPGSRRASTSAQSASTAVAVARATSKPRRIARRTTTRGMEGASRASRARRARIAPAATGTAAMGTR